MFIKISAFTLALTASIALSSRAWCVEPVIVAREGQSIWRDGRAVLALPKGSILLVHRRAGDQAWVETKNQDKVVGGWVASSSLRAYRYRPLASVCLVRDCQVEAGGRSVTLNAGTLKLIDRIQGDRLYVLVNGYGLATIHTTDVIPHRTALAYFQRRIEEGAPSAADYLARGVFHFYAGGDGEMRQENFLSQDAWTEIPVLTSKEITQSYENASQDLARAIQLGAKSPEAHLFLGLMLLKQGNPRDAIVQFEQARVLKLEEQEFHAVRAMARRALEDAEGALADFEQALSKATAVARGNLLQSLHQWMMERQFIALRDEASDSERLAEVRLVEKIRALLAKHASVATDISANRPLIDSLMLAHPDTTFRPTYPAWERLWGRPEGNYDPNSDDGRERIKLAEQRLKLLGLPYAARVIALDSKERVFLPMNWGRSNTTSAAIEYLTSPAREWDGGGLRVDDVLPQSLESDDEKGIRDLLKYEKEPARDKRNSYARTDADQLQGLWSQLLVFDRADLFREMGKSVRDVFQRDMASDKTGEAHLCLAFIELVEGNLEQGRRLAEQGRELHRREQERRHREEVEAWEKRGNQQLPNFNVIGPQAMRLREAMKEPPQRHDNPLFRNSTCDVLMPLLTRDAVRARDGARRVFEQRNFSHEALLGLGEAYAFAIPSASGANSSNRRAERRLLAIYQLADLGDDKHAIARYESLANMRRTLTRSSKRFVDRPHVLAKEFLTSLQGQHAALHVVQCSKDEVPSLQDRADWIQARVAAENERVLDSIHLYSIGNRFIKDVEEQASPWRDMKSIQDSLRPRQVAVEFLRGRTIDYGNQSQGYRMTPLIYGAWVLRKDSDPRFIQLGSAEGIERQLFDVRQRLRDSPRTWKDKEQVKELESALRRLGEAVLDPLQIDFSQVDELTVAPDGELWLLPWCALRLQDQRFLAEACAVTQRFTLGDHGEQTIPDKASFGPPAIFANPNCDALPQTIRRQEQELTGATYEDFVQVPLRNAELGFEPFTDLPASDAEAAAVQPILATLTGREPQVYTRDQAIEAMVKRLEAPEYLMFSSHGYFLSSPRAGSSNQRVGIDVSFPLVRGGIVLAGANHCHEWGEARGCDGVLTSQEVAFLNLRHTRLVTLSGCDTGLGDLPYGEGVAGLRQAFFLAGAQNVLASLWSVDDRSTAELMARMFQNMAAGQNLGESLRAAQREQISYRKNRYGDTHPFFWAAWTLTSR
jgi:CHAT domain-containing protein